MPVARLPAYPLVFVLLLLGFGTRRTALGMVAVAARVAVVLVLSGEGLAEVAALVALAAAATRSVLAAAPLLLETAVGQAKPGRPL